MKTLRLLAALLLTAFTAGAEGAVTQTVSELDGTSSPAFTVGNFFDSWYEVHHRGGAGAGNVTRPANDSSETYAPGGTLPDHESVYTARNDSTAAGKAVVANGAAAGSRSGFGGAGEGSGGGGGGGASRKSPSGQAAKPDSKTSGDTAPVEGLKPLKADTFLASLPDTLQLQTGAGQELSVDNALESPMDWRWTSLRDSDKDIWKSPGRTAGYPVAAHVRKSEILTPDNPETRRNLNPKNQSVINRIPVVFAPEPAGVMTMAGLLGLALFSRRRSAIRL